MMHATSAANNSAMPLRRADLRPNGYAEQPRPLLRQEAPADPFPVDALLGLAAAARAIQARTQAPTAIAGQSVLAVATLATQAHANVALPSAQERPLSNFFVTVGVSGERKSGVDSVAGAPLEEFERRLRDRFAVESATFANEKVAYDRLKDGAIKSKNSTKKEIAQALTDLGAEPSEPLAPVVTADDFTIEGLSKLLERARPSVGIFAAEAGMFVGGHGMTQESRLRTAAGLCSLWDGTPLRIVRATGLRILPGRRCALHVMGQPQVLAEMLSDEVLQDQGLLSRMLVTAPASTIGTRFWRDAPEDSDRVLREYNSRILDCLEYPLPLVSGKTNELDPRKLSLTPDARSAWIRFADHIEGEMGSNGSLALIRSRANKLPEIAARLAGVLALFHDIDAREITGPFLAAAIELANHYAAEGLRLHEGAQVGGDLRRAQRLLAWLDTSWNEPAISLPDIYQLGPNEIRDQAAAKRLVGILEDHGWLLRIEGGATVGGKRRRDAWQIRRAGE